MAKLLNDWLAEHILIEDKKYAHSICDKENGKLMEKFDELIHICPGCKKVCSADNINEPKNWVLNGRDILEISDAKFIQSQCPNCEEKK